MDDVFFADRRDAGQQLAARLSVYQHCRDGIVLALPRGGVPVAYEIARALQLPLDVFIVRKLGVPDQEELAMGAIASGDVTVFNSDIVEQCQVSEADIQRVMLKEGRELQRREARYRGDRPFPLLSGRTLILVDDGIATGASIKAAIKALHQHAPKKLIIAIPVAPRSSIDELHPLVDEVVCLHAVTRFYGVGGFYRHFAQTTDEEVCSLLQFAANQRPGPSG